MQIDESVAAELRRFEQRIAATPLAKVQGLAPTVAAAFQELACLDQSSQGKHVPLLEPHVWVDQAKVLCKPLPHDQAAEVLVRMRQQLYR